MSIGKKNKNILNNYSTTDVTKILNEKISLKCYISMRFSKALFSIRGS